MVFVHRLSLLSSVVGGLLIGALLLSNAGLMPWYVSRQSIDSGMCALAFSEQVSVGFSSA